MNTLESKLLRDKTNYGGATWFAIWKPDILDFWGPQKWESTKTFFCDLNGKTWDYVQTIGMSVIKLSPGDHILPCAWPCKLNAHAPAITFIRHVLWAKFCKFQHHARMLSLVQVNSTCQVSFSFKFFGQTFFYTALFGILLVKDFTSRKN